MAKSKRKKWLKEKEAMAWDGFSQDDVLLRQEKEKGRDLKASQWWKRQLAKGVCHYCKETFPASELTMDHVIPLARGGKSVKGNVVAACKDCNTKKSSNLPMEMEELDQES